MEDYNKPNILKLKTTLKYLQRSSVTQVSPHSIWIYVLAIGVFSSLTLTGDYIRQMFSFHNKTLRPDGVPPPQFELGIIKFTYCISTTNLPLPVQDCGGVLSFGDGARFGLELLSLRPTSANIITLQHSLP